VTEVDHDAASRHGVAASKGARVAVDAAATTHSELVVRALRCFPNHTAFRQGDRTLTYREAERLLAQTVSVLRELGLRAGDGVALLSPNRPEAWVSQVAPGFLGCSYTALHPLGSFDDHLYACNEAELKVLLVDPGYADRAAALLENAPSLEHVLTFGPADVGRDLLTLVDRVSPTALDRCQTDPDTINWLLYTGGTTGVPKAAELPERAVAQMAFSTSVGWDLPARRDYLAVAPISHAAGMMITAVLMAGGSVTLMNGWDPQEWVDTVSREKITLSLLVPTMIYSLLDSGVLDSADTSSIETIMYGSSPMAPARLREAIERLGSVFCQLYGQTECAGIVTSLWRHHHDLTRPERFGSCGLPMPGARVTLRDDDNEPVANGDRGEVCVQGLSVMKGYHKRPDLSREALAGGWLRTGDIAFADPEGFLYLVDRKKDMIVSGGFNIFPSEIEQVLTNHPHVSAAAVIGVPDPKWGEAVKAIVVPRPGATLDASALIALVKQYKGSHYAPKSLDIVEALPTNPLGKPDKKSLRRKYWPKSDRQIG
jgi:fatty-acyl-CoA synthase